MPARNGARRRVRPTVRSIILLLVLSLIAGGIGPGTPTRTPWATDDQLALEQAMALSPKQSTRPSGGQPAEETSSSGNQAGPKSLQGKYPPIAGKQASAPRNETRVEQGPSSVRGFDESTSKEIPEQRTDRERTYRNTDGTHTTEFNRDPVNYRTKDGKYESIDTAVVDASPSEWRNRADAVDLRFARRADGSPLVRTRLDDGHELAFGILDANASAGRVEGNSITYAGVRLSADVRIDVQPGGFKETLVLASPDAPHTWTFPLQLKGLRPSVVDGRVAFTDEKGNERVQFPRGFMTDASQDSQTGDPATYYGVTYRLVDHQGQPALRVELDSAWLRDPARRYPVAVDPSVETFTVASSMFVQGGSRTDGAQDLKIGNNGGSKAAAYLRFDVRSRLANHKIFGAQLLLTNYWSWSCQPRPVTVHAVTAPWGTSGGFPGPAYGPALAEASFAHGFIAQGQVKSGCPTAHAPINLGVPGRDVVQDWVTGARENHGLTVRASETDSYGWKKFYGYRTANPPRLFVTHSPYDADYRIDNGVIDPPVTRNQSGKVKVTVTNRGVETWTPATFALGYRAFTAKDGRPVASVEAAQLPHDVARGGSVTLEATVKPLEPDDYLLDFSMLRKGGAWFTDEQIAPIRLLLRVIDVPPIVKAQYPPNGYSSQTLTPQLWVDAVDVDAPPNLAPQYRFEVCENYVLQDGKLVGVGCTDSGYVNARFWTVPVGALRWSKDYQWRAFGYDGHSESEALPPSHILTAVPQPEITAQLATAPYSGANTDFHPQTGNYFSSAIDASVTTTGPPLTVVRTYNSLDPRRDLVFGAGWSSRYDMRVIPDGDGSGNVVVTYPDGQQVRFGRNADGTFAAPPGRSANFRAMLPQEGGGWALVDQASTLYRFRPDGRLITIHDEAGHWIELDYASPERLRRAINRTSDRILYFTWSGSHISQVSTDLIGGRQLTWNYTYDGDKLTQVCDPKNGCTRYEYTTGSHYRSSVTDSLPGSYWRLGEQNGTDADSQVRTNLGKDKGKYKDVTLQAPGALAGTGDTSASFNGTSSVLTLPDGTVRKNRDLAVEMWFRTTTGGPLFGYQNKPVGQSSAAATPMLYVGTDGKLRGQFANGKIQPITSPSAVNDNQWHHVVLSGSLATQTLYLDGRPVGTTIGEIDHDELTYNQVGLANTTEPGFWPAWGNQAQRFFAGQIDEIAYYEHPLGPTSVAAHYQERAVSDQLTKITLPSGRVAAQLSYDNAYDRVREYLDRNGGLWKIAVPVVTGTPENLIRTAQITDPGNRHHFYDYDPKRGRILRYIAPLGLSVRDEDRRDSAGVPTPPTQPTCPSTPPPPDEGPIYCGGPPGGGGEWVGGPVKGQGVRTYDYDDNGFQNTITDETGNKVTLGLDERGNVTSRKTCRIAPGDCQTAYYAYYFNPQDFTDPRNNKMIASRDARSSGSTDDRYLTSYAFTGTGQRGLLERETKPDGGATRHTYTTGSEPAVGGGNAPPGLLATTTDPRDAVTKYSYYNNGDLAQITSPSGMVTKFTYDMLGRKTSETQVSDSFPQGVTTTYEYDELTRPTSVTAPATTNAVTGVKHTSRTTTSYDADGNPERIEISDTTGGDPARVTATVYDERGRAYKTTDPEGGTTFHGYDVFGNRTSTVDPMGTRYEYAYTSRNKIAEVRLRAWHGQPVDPDNGQGGDGDGEATVHDTLVLESYGYDMAGRQVRHTDAVGRTTRYEYFTDDRLRRVIARDVRDPANPNAPPRNVLLQQNTYDAAGNLVQETSATGRVTTYEYDPVGRLTATTEDPNGLRRRTEVAYDKNGNVTSTTRTGNSSNSTRLDLGRIEKTEFGYDTASRRTSQTVHNGQERLVTTSVLDQRGLPRSVTDPRGAGYTTDTAFDELGRPTTVTAPTVQVERDTPVAARPKTVTGYNTFSEATHTVDPAGNTSVRGYDRRGLTIRVESPDYRKPGDSAPLRGVVQTQYDTLGHPVAVTDPRGGITRYRYDQLGRLVEVRDPKHDAPAETGGITKITYNTAGEQLSITDPTGSRVEATYDDLGRQTTSTKLERRPQPAAYTTVLRYNDDGDLISSTSPTGDLTSHTYDAVGERITTKDPANVVSQFGYDLAGNRVRASDGLGRTTWTNRDGAGRVIAEHQLDPAERILRSTRRTLDQVGNTLTATDALNRTSTFTYDALNRVTTQQEPFSANETISTSFGYDANGTLTRFTDGRGNSTRYTPNSLGLTETITEPSTTAHPNLGDRTWTIGYDLAGNPTTVNAPGGVTTQRTYDALGRLTNQTGSGAQVPTDDRVAGYDLAGRLTSVSTPGAPNTYTYNDRGVLLTTAGPGGNSSYTYDADDRQTQRVDAAGTLDITYTQGRAHTVRDGITNTTQTLGYDGAGALKTVNYGANRVREFTYDDFARLRTDTLRDNTTPVASIAYDYDIADQLTRKTTTGYGAAADNTYDYHPAGTLKSWTNNGTTTGYEWDKAGNRVKSGTKAATYDERNRLQSAGDYTYTWSPRGTLNTRTSSGLTETSVYDAFDRLTTSGNASYRYDGLNRLSTRDNQPFTYVGTSLELASDPTATYSRSPDGAVLALSQGTDKRLTLADQHGDLVGGFAPPSANLTDSATFDPFGRALATTGTKRSLGYQSDYTDPSTGGVDMGARWYSPTTGSFTARDNIPLPTTPSAMANRYTYATGAPTNNVDPDGHLCTGARKAVAKVAKKESVSFGAFITAVGSCVAPRVVPIVGWFQLGWDIAEMIDEATMVPKGVGRVTVPKGIGGPGTSKPSAGAGSGIGGLIALAAVLGTSISALIDLLKKIKWPFGGGGGGPGGPGGGGGGQGNLTELARKAAEELGRKKPIPVPPGVSSPHVENPVSSSPNSPAGQTTDVIDNVQDTNEILDKFKDAVLDPRDPVVKSTTGLDPSELNDGDLGATTTLYTDEGVFRIDRSDPTQLKSHQFVWLVEHLKFGSVETFICLPKVAECGPNGEPIYNIPPGSSDGVGAKRRIPSEMLGAFDIGVNATPGSITPLCSYCRSNPATSVDHVSARISGGDLTALNTTPACTFCNSSKKNRVAPVNPPLNYAFAVWPPPWWPAWFK